MVGLLDPSLFQSPFGGLLGQSEYRPGIGGYYFNEVPDGPTGRQRFMNWLSDNHNRMSADEAGRRMTLAPEASMGYGSVAPMLTIPPEWYYLQGLNAGIPNQIPMMMGR